MADLTPSPGVTLAAGIIWPPLCLAAVSLRLYARRRQSGNLLIDDWLTIPALVFTWGMGLIVIAGTAMQIISYPTPPPDPGYTVADATSFKFRTIRLFLWIYSLFQILGLTAIKLSFVFFYRRIFVSGVGRTGFDIATKISIVILSLWSLGCFLSYFFICDVNFSAYWTNEATLETQCHNDLEWQNAFAISDFILDWIVYLLPIYPVLKLHMSTSKRLAVLGIFSFGLVTIAASLTRLVIYVKSIHVGFGAHVDHDLLVSGALYWSLIESGLALLAACLPTIYGHFNRSKNAKSTMSKSKKSSGRERDRSSFSPLSNGRDGSMNGSEHRAIITTDIEQDVEDIHLKTVSSGVTYNTTTISGGLEKHR